MHASTFMQKLEERWSGRHFLCVGLDSEYSKLPEMLKKGSVEDALLAFNKAIIDATADTVCTFKPNSAFYEAEGKDGYQALKKTVEYIHEAYPDIPVILDAKRGDIGNTNAAYARAVFDDLQVDAVTVSPFMGKESLKPFLERKEKGIFVLSKTSNPGSGEFQDIRTAETGEPLYLFISRTVFESWNEFGNCGLAVGTTYPKEIAAIRAVVGDMPLLMPGVGPQGGDVATTVSAGKGINTFAMIINASRAVIYASDGNDFADAAKKAALSLSQEIEKSL
ncbi:orotidine-5'-phosphate decarboxylase [Candidatus Kaiserbacteria bacterium]|nr:orotidine-5'-phosphate decarboxylase [Candidatus Kaiserbacteria bacterium]